MWKRSYWVLLTYLKRPMTWLFALAALLCSVVLYNLVDDKVRSVSLDITSDEAIRTLEQLETVLATDPSKPVELDYDRLYSLATRKVFPHPRDGILHIGAEEQALMHAELQPVEGLRNVVAMKTGYAVDQALINRIGKFKSLKRLSMFADLGHESLDLQPLSNLTNLEVLQFGVVSRVNSLKPLAELPGLHTLAIAQSLLVRKQGLDEVANLPHLRELWLPDLRSYSGLQDTVGKLTQSKTLQRLHYGVSWDDAAALAEVQAQVSGIQVVPSKVRAARHVVLFFALLAVAVAGFPAMQLAGQLSLPSSHLAPLYRAPHYLVAGVLIATLILAMIAGLVSVGANLLTASSMMLCVGAVHVWSSTRMISIEKATKSTRLVNLLVALPVGLLPFLVLASSFYNPMLVEDFLMSGHTVVSLLFVATAIGLGRVAFQNLESRLTKRLELGQPAILSFHDLQARSAELANSSETAFPLNKPLVAGQNLEKLAKGALAVTLLSIPIRALGFEDLGRTAMMTCLGSLFLCVFVTGVKWWKEMPYFASTTTRPPNRTGHADRLIRDVTFDLMKLTPLLLACVIASCVAGPWQLEGIGFRLLHGIVAVVSVSLAVHAAILWILAIRSVIGIVVLAVACYLPCSMMLLQIAVLDRMASPLVSALTIVASGCLLAAISLAAIVFARRHYTRIEWAKFH